MPYQIKKLNNGHYQVLNELTGRIHARDTTHKKAMTQLHILGTKHRKFNKLHSYNI